MKSSNTDRALQISIGILMVAFFWMLWGGFHERVVVAGDSAPGFTIRADDGRTISRTNFGGKVLVLNFWATWCPPCIEEFPSLDRFQKKFADSGVVVLAVSVDKNPRLYQNFLRRAHPSFVTARDPEANISASYGTYQYPETYIIDRNGKVVEKVISAQDWGNPETERLVKSLL